MLVISAALKRLVLIRLNPNDDVLPSLQAAVDRERIGHALILNGTGSVSSYHFHDGIACAVQEVGQPHVRGPALAFRAPERGHPATEQSV